MPRRFAPPGLPSAPAASKGRDRAVPRLKGREASKSADYAVGDKAKDEETRKSKHYTKDDRRAVCVRPLEQGEGPHSPNHNQDAAHHEYGHRDQDSQTMKLPTSL